MDKKQSWYNILFIICVVLLINSIPFALFIKEDVLLNVLEISKRVVALITLFVLCKKEKVDKAKFSKLDKKSLLFIPFGLAFASNFLVVLFNKETLNENINYLNIIYGFINMALIAIIEELLFRHLLLNEFLKNNTKKILAIIYSSLIFGGIHLLNITSFGDILYCIVQSIYTFFLGLLFGFSYVYLKNIIIPILFHFFFNFLNDVLVTELFNLQFDLSFYLINIAVGIILFVYGFILYKKISKGEIKNVA